MYVDHLVLNEVACDADGDVVFQLPQPVTKRTLIEVLTRPVGRGGPGAGPS